MQKFKRVLAFLLSFIMMVSSVNLTSALTVSAAEETEAQEVSLTNVALNDGVTVYTSSNNSNSSIIVDGNTSYQWSKSNRISFLDVAYNGGSSAQDEDGYYYKDGTYVIVDLGNSYLIDSLTIYDFQNLASGPRDYIYDVSLCNDEDFTVENQALANWTYIGTPEKGSDTCITDFELSDKMVARYIKLDNLKTLGATSFALSEVQAYGMPVTSVDDVKAYALNELETYKADAKLTSADAEDRAAVVEKYSVEINEQTTVDTILSVLNEGLKEINKAVLIENIALGKTVYTSSNNSNSYIIVDGDTSYQWSSSNRISFLDVAYDGSSSAQDEFGYYYKEGTYIIVDLGYSYLIDSFTMYDLQNLVSGPRDYIYDVSLCNDEDFSVENQSLANWTYIGSPEKGSDTCITDIDLSDKMIARYIKLDNLKTLGATSFALSELEAYGMAIDDLSSVKEYALKELNTYFSDLTLNAEESAARTEAILEYTTEIDAADTVEAVVTILNDGYERLDEVLELAKYRDEAKNEISDYQNKDGLFDDADRTAQLDALEKALQDIEAAADKATVDEIVSTYKALVDSFEVLGEYEIIPSPHSISYKNTYYPYYKQINVVRVDGSLDKETIDYINEIFGSENVTFSTEKDDAKLNLYLTSDDMDDAVETWIRNTYGDQVNEETLAKSEAHVIFADGNGISIIGNDAEGLFRGLTTIKFIKEQIEANPKGYRGFVINDYADMAFRGLIEGYYGNPWSWSEKAELLEFGSDYKMNKIVYAPKNDPYHTTKWKDLYPDESEDPENNIQNVMIAAQTARKYKADFVWTAHCFGYTDSANAGENGIRYNEGDENVPGSDINLLKAKFQQMYDAGVRTFGLLLDDCDYGPRTLNTPWENIYNPNEALTEEVLAETTAIVNIMADWCAEKGDCYDLIFCPASYNTSWMKNSYARFYTQAYQYQEVSYYDLHFRDNVQIITTGSGTFSDTSQAVLDTFKTAGVSSQTGYNDGDERRSPLFWTNYPTVDAGNVLDFGPIVNFKTDVDPDDIYGLMSNPFQWAQFNKTVIPMVCQYTWNLKDYDATEVYNNSMKYVMDTEELAEAMLIFTNHNNKRGNEGEGTTELINAIAAFKTNTTKENAEAVLAEIDKIINACDVLLDKDRYTTIGMYEQIYPYANSLRDLAESIQKYMIIFQEDCSKPFVELNAADELYTRHTTYELSVLGSTSYTATGTRTLLPFANWLRENESTILLSVYPDNEAEINLYTELVTYLEEQINLVPDTYYYQDWEQIRSILKEQKEQLAETSLDEMPTLESLTSTVEELLKDFVKPIKNADNLVSNDKEVSGGSLENSSKWPAANIIDGKPGTTCSTVMGDSENPAYVQIDLGKNMSLQEIMVGCYYGDARWYNYDIYTSVDGETFELLVSKDDTTSESINGANGFWFNADGTNARYIKVVGVRCSVNNYFHVGEVQIYVKDNADYTVIEAAIAKIPVDLSIYTDETVKAVRDAVVTALLFDDDKNGTEQSEVDGLAKAIDDAVAALEYKDADYTAVDRALASVPTDLSVYTEETAEAVTEAVAAVVEGKDITEQKAVDAWAEAIVAAVQALEYKPAAYEAVNEAIAKVPEDLTIYTKESVNALNKAVAAVENDKKITEQEIVDAWAKAILDAVDELEVKDADYSKVEAAIAKVPEDLSIYKEETVKAVNEAVAAVVEGKKVTEQSEVDAMAEAITDAVAALELKDADYTAVEEALAKVPMDLSIYTEETAKAVRTAEQKVLLYGNKKITEQSEIDAMVKALEDAVAALEYKDADYSKVEEAIAQVPEDLSVYTDETAKAVNEAVAAVVEGKNITEQSEVDAMAAAIMDAIGNLELIEIPEPDNPFKDVVNDPFFYDAVLWALEMEITEGTSETTFEPFAECTRANVVTFLWRANGCPEPEAVENPFVDIAEDAYYYKAILWAAEKGITDGTSKTAFSPDDTCTRAQIVTFLWREAGKPEPEADNCAFEDVSDLAYYRDAVLWAVEKGITQGKSDTAFDPDAICNRGETVTFLYRAVNGTNE